MINSSLKKQENQKKKSGKTEQWRTESFQITGRQEDFQGASWELLSLEGV